MSSTAFVAIKTSCQKSLPTHWFFCNTRWLDPEHRCLSVDNFKRLKPRVDFQGNLEGQVCFSTTVLLFKLWTTVQNRHIFRWLFPLDGHSSARHGGAEVANQIECISISGSTIRLRGNSPRSPFHWLSLFVLLHRFLFKEWQVLSNVSVLWAYSHKQTAHWLIWPTWSHFYRWITQVT